MAANLSQFFLNAEETHHATKVLRFRTGDDLFITDGKGNIYRGQLHSTTGQEAEVGNLRLEEQQEQPFRIHLSLSPVKNMNRIEWLLEKATEIGVAEISFVNCHRTQRTRLRYDRLQKIVVEAMKQSMNAFLPKLNEMVDLECFLAQERSGQRFIGYCETGMEQNLAKLYQPGNDATFLIGPEGDFTAEEVLKAKAKGFERISLGKARLRTETAALMAVATVHVVNQGMV